MIMKKSIFINVCNISKNVCREPYIGIGPNNFRYECAEPIYSVSKLVVVLIHIAQLFNYYLR